MHPGAVRKLNNCARRMADNNPTEVDFNSPLLPAIIEVNAFPFKESSINLFLEQCKISNLSKALKSKFSILFSLTSKCVKFCKQAKCISVGDAGFVHSNYAYPIIA